MPVTAEILQAMDEIRATFPDSDVSCEEDGQGGAWVRVDPVATGPSYAQSSTWVAFQITFPYPDADVYPHFVRSDLSRIDAQPLGEAFQQVSWGPRVEPGTQISRRTNQVDARTNNAAAKALNVVSWMSAR
jgi:hypothetical protein